MRMTRDFYHQATGHVWAILSALVIDSCAPLAVCIGFSQFAEVYASTTGESDNTVGVAEGVQDWPDHLRKTRPDNYWSDQNVEYIRLRQQIRKVLVPARSEWSDSFRRPCNYN